MKINPLLFIPSPRDIPKVIESIGKLKIDKIWIKYHEQEDAYNHARVFFLHHDFTHLIIHPDDMIAKPQDLAYLIEDINNEPDRVIGGYCNVTAGTTDYEDANISYSLPPDPPRASHYEDYNFIKLKDLQEGIIQVKHSGFGLLALPRAVVRKIPFRCDYGCCPDACFSTDLDKANITQYVDTRIYCRHIRTKPDILQVGKKQKQVIICTDEPTPDIRLSVFDKIRNSIAFIDSNDKPTLAQLREQLSEILQ